MERPGSCLPEALPVHHCDGEFGVSRLYDRETAAGFRSRIDPDLLGGIRWSITTSIPDRSSISPSTAPSPVLYALCSNWLMIRRRWMPCVPSLRCRSIPGTARQTAICSPTSSNGFSLTPSNRSMPVAGSVAGLEGLRLGSHVRQRLPVGRSSAGFFRRKKHLHPREVCSGSEANCEPLVSQRL